MRVIELALKDLLQILRDKRSLLFLAAMPIAFTLIMGFVYQGEEDGGPQDLSMSIAWVETEPAGVLSRMLYARLEESDILELHPMEAEAAFEFLKRGQVNGVLVIPSGFGEQDEDILTGGPSSASFEGQIRLITDTTTSEADSLYQLLRVPISHLMSAVEIGKMNVETMGDPAEFFPALDLAWQEWEKNGSQRLVRMEKDKVQESESWFGENPYNQASPGMLVQFAIMGLVTSAQILVRERKSRTLQRQIATAMKPWEILVGHMLGMFMVVFMQIALLMIFGQLILGVNYLGEPVSVLLVGVSLGIWVSSLGLLIGLMAKEDDQVILYSMIAMFVFSALGGAWFPLGNTGGVLVAIGKVLPSAWAMTGLQNILVRGLGLPSAWQSAGILLAYTLGFFLISVWRFKTMEL